MSPIIQMKNPRYKEVKNFPKVTWLAGGGRETSPAARLAAQALNPDAVGVVSSPPPGRLSLRL